MIGVVRVPRGKIQGLSESVRPDASQLQGTRGAAEKAQSPEEVESQVSGVR